MTAAELFSALASVALLLWCFASRPVAWHTAPGWYMNGVRPSGDFEMRPAPGGDPVNDGTDGHPDTWPDDDRRIAGRIYCTGGTRPAVSADSVWCQR